MQNIINIGNIKLLLLYLLPICIILGQFELNLNILLTSIIFLLSSIFTNKKNYFYKDKIFICFFIFFFYIFVSLILSDYTHTRYIFKTIAILISAVYIFALSDFLGSLNKNYFKKLILFYFLLNIFLYFDLIYQFTHPNFKDIFGFQVDTLRSYNIFGKQMYLPLRLSGPFNNELVPGFYLSTFGSLSIFLFYYKTNLKEKNIIFLYSLLCINFFFVIFTGERSSSIISFLVLSLFILYNEKKIVRIFLYFIVIASLIFLVVKFNPVTSERFNDILYWLSSDHIKDNLLSSNNTNNPIDAFMLTQWGKHYLISIEVFKDNYLFGSGIRTFREICGSYEIELSLTKACSTHPHHYLLEILSETGIIGLLIFLFIIYLIVQKNNSNNKDILSISLLIIILCYLFPIRPTGSIFSSWHGGFFYILIGFNFYFLNSNNEKKHI